MKKIFLVVALITGICGTGISQNAEKALKANKWYSNADLGATTMVLYKTTVSKVTFDAKFKNNGVMNYCANVKQAFLDPQGTEIAAGTYYCDTKYSYEVKGDVLKVNYPLVNWFYKVKSLKNGDLELTLSPNENW